MTLSTPKGLEPGLSTSPESSVASKSLASLVSLIIVNYNGGEATSRCLDLLLTGPDRPGQVIVVDNGSSDESRIYLENIQEAGLRRGLRVVWSEQNTGYAGGVNLGASFANRPYLAIMNMDVEVEPDWLLPAVAFLEATPQAGAVSPLILLSDGQRINAEGQDVHVTGLGFNRHLYYPFGHASPAPVPVSGIHGAAFIVRRSLFEEVGGMDAGAFLYHEDVNISWLLQLMGYDLYCVPGSRVRHHYDLSMHPAKLMLLERNRLTMLLSYCSLPFLLALAVPLACTEAMMWGYCLLQGWTFLKAKGSSYRQIVGRWSQIIARRSLARKVRTRSDWQMLGRLRWFYALDQFTKLARERGARRRSWDLPPREPVQG